MKIFLRFFIFFFSLNAFALCEFKSDLKGVVSFSGVSTVIMKELGLLGSPKLTGISIFNPIGKQEFQGKVYPGGIFLSQNSLADLEGQVVFYDEGRDQRKILSSRPKIKRVEIQSRSLTPNEANESALKVLRPFLQGCDKKILELKSEIKNLEDKLLHKIPSDQTMIFYLGELRGERVPEMLMVNDGVIKWLLQNKKLKTYPSALPYVNWSMKFMQVLPKDSLKVGLKDSGRDLLKEIKKSPAGITLIYPGALVPGISQLQAFLFLMDHL